MQHNYEGLAYIDNYVPIYIIIASSQKTQVTHFNSVHPIQLICIYEILTLFYRRSKYTK